MPLILIKYSRIYPTRAIHMAGSNVPAQTNPAGWAGLTWGGHPFLILWVGILGPSYLEALGSHFHPQPPTSMAPRSRLLELRNESRH